ncbi:DUF309 domain protein [Wolffia australiana]
MAATAWLAARTAPLLPSIQSHHPSSRPFIRSSSCSSSPFLPGYRVFKKSTAFCAGYRFFPEESSDDDHSDGEEQNFDQAVLLFNSGDYHKSHDVLEELWYDAEEPSRTLIHGILQCAVGFHHLFNQNHRGAMMQLGEGLGKLRKMDFDDGPFVRFEREISAALEFIYQTQKELAACTNDLCLAMDGSERSYLLLGSFAAGQRLYTVEMDSTGISYIIFDPEGNYTVQRPERVKIPTLLATEEHLPQSQ